MFFSRLKLDSKYISKTSSMNTKVENGNGVLPVKDYINGNVSHFSGNKESYVKLYNPPSTVMTISCWVKKLDENPGVIFSNGHGKGRYSCYFGMGHKDIGFNFKKNYYIYTDEFPVLKWIHIVSIYSEDKTDLYIDGVFVNSIPNNLKPDLSSIVFGKDPELPGFEFNGYMSDIRIYGKILPSEFITKMYINGPNKFVEDKDITKIGKSKISDILQDLETDEIVKAKIKNNLKDESLKFVRESEKVDLSSSILTPFLKGVKKSQIELNLDDNSSEIVKYDEIENTIKVKSQTYKVGDRFILGGKTIRVSELK